MVFLFQLQMLGYDISWAGFNIIEVMSSSKFTYKRIGYLASSQSFHTDTDVCIVNSNYLSLIFLFILFDFNIYLSDFYSVINVDYKYDT